MSSVKGYVVSFVKCVAVLSLLMILLGFYMWIVHLIVILIGAGEAAPLFYVVAFIIGFAAMVHSVFANC